MGTLVVGGIGATQYDAIRYSYGGFAGAMVRLDAVLLCIYGTCRRLIDLSPIVYACRRLIDLSPIVYTCRCLIDLSLSLSLSLSL